MTGNELKRNLEAKLKKFLERNDKETLPTSHIKPKNKTPVQSGFRIAKREEFSKMICEEPCEKPDFYNTIINEWLEPGKSYHKDNIAIVGPSQIGKTQLLKKILLDVKHKYDYVFFVTLDSFCGSESGFVLNFLTCNKSDVRRIDEEGGQQEETCKKVIENLMQGSLNEESPTTVCIVLDQWDNETFDMDLIKKKNCSVNFFSKAQFRYFLKLILDDGFANSKLLMLLSPWQFDQLHQKFNYAIFVKGINHEEQKLLVAKGCTETSYRLDNACWAWIIESHERDQCCVCTNCHQDNGCHHELQSLCFVPGNCKILLRCSLGCSSPSTVVHHAFLIFFHTMVTKYENFDWYEIGLFAWEMYKNRFFTFTTFELKYSKLSDTVINVLFNCKSENLSDVSSTYCIFFFSHVLLHEFLAALGLLSLSIPNFETELENHEKVFVDGSFAVVYEFMSEICKEISLKLLLRCCDLKQQNLDKLKTLLHY